MQKHVSRVSLAAVACLILTLGGGVLALDCAALAGFGDSDALPMGLKPGRLLVNCAMTDAGQTRGWRMEGAGQVGFEKGWMTLQSPGASSGVVYWCPWDLPGDFVAEWDVQNLDPGSGRCAVYCSARGRNGEDIFAPSQPPRAGSPAQYANGSIDNYQVSYYVGQESGVADADAGASDAADPGAIPAVPAIPRDPDVPDVPDASSFRRAKAKAMAAATDDGGVHKNAGFALVQRGDIGVDLDSDEVHRARLIKAGGRIMMFIDGRGFVNWLDDGRSHGPVLGAGKLGFRQSRHAHFRYRHFMAWELRKDAGSGASIVNGANAGNANAGQ